MRRTGLGEFGHGLGAAMVWMVYVICRLCTWLVDTITKKTIPPASKSSHKTLKGEMVRSKGEKTIADYLYKNKIEYVYEPKVKFPEGILCPDFGIEHEGNKILIEYWGMGGNEQYEHTMKYKQRLYKKYKTHMINLYYRDLDDLDQAIKFRLKKPFEILK